MLDSAGLDPHEITVLALTRFYFQSFAMPQSHAWIHCLEMAQAQYGEADGLVLAGRILSALKAVRSTRRSLFCFNSPTCHGCASVLTEHERRLIVSLAALRRGQDGTARTELMMLCEGNDTADVISAFIHLAEALPQPFHHVEEPRVFKSSH